MGNFPAVNRADFPMWGGFVQANLSAEQGSKSHVLDADRLPSYERRERL